MLDTYRNNVVSCLILSSSTAKGAYSVEPGNTMLYGLAPLPYATGLLPLLLDDEIHLEYLPPVKEAEKMSFSERNKLGFKLGLKKGIDFFFAVGSVTYYISSSFAKMSGGGSKKGIKNVFQYSPALIARYISGKKKAAREGRSIAPKDVFRLRGFMCAGTDNRCYKDDLEKLWGIRSCKRSLPELNRDASGVKHGRETDFTFSRIHAFLNLYLSLRWNAVWQTAHTSRRRAL